MDKSHNRIIYISLTVMLLVQVLLAAWAWQKIPGGTLIPMHWSLAGTVDGYAPKGFALSLMPIIAAFLLMVQLAIHRTYSPEELAASGLVVYVRSLGAAILLTVVQAIIAFAGVGYAVPVSSIVPMCIGVLFLVLGYAVRKLPPGVHMGTKRPWIHLSAKGQARTNSFAGWMLMLIGVAAIVTGAIGNMYLFAIVLVAGVLAMLAGTSVYAWLNSRS